MKHHIIRRKWWDYTADMTASVRLSNQTDEWWIINISRVIVLAAPPAWCDSISPLASLLQPRVINSPDISLFGVPGTTKNTPGPADVSAADKIICASCGYITQSHWKLGENSKAKVKPSEKNVSSSFQAAVNLLYASGLWLEFDAIIFRFFKLIRNIPVFKKLPVFLSRVSVHLPWFQLGLDLQL